MEEVREADLLLHVIDCSHSNAGLQIESVKKVLEEIGAGDKPVINVFNKTDRLEGGMVPPHLKLIEDDAIALSALTGAGINDLIAAIGREVR